MKFVPFSSWNDVLEFAKTHTNIFYKAPMDLKPVSIRIVKVHGNDKIRVHYSSVGCWTIDSGHLDRCYELK